MKKIITILTLVFIVNTSYSQDKTIKDPKTVDKVLDKTSDAISKVYDDGSKVINKAYEAGSIVAPKVEQALKAIGTEFKVGANKAWDILLKQQLVWSICFLFLTISSILSWIHLVYRFNKGQKELVEGTDSYGRKTDVNKQVWKDSNMVMFTISLAISLTLSGLSIYNFQDMLTGFINPEFGAMKTIAEIASQIK